MINKEADPLPNKQSVQKAIDLVLECLELNKIPVPVGISACISVCLGFLQATGANEEAIQDILNSINSCVLHVGGSLKIVNRGNNDQSS